MGNWLKRIGILSIFAFPLSVILYRLDIAPFSAVIKLIQAGVVIGALVFVVGVIYFLIKRNSEPLGAKAALLGALIALIQVVPMALQVKKAKSLPFIHNVSTDTVNAPAFDKIATLRSQDDNPHEYNPDQVIGEAGLLGQLQQQAYPNVKTHVTDLTLPEALKKAESLVKKLGWETVNVDAQKGIIEATETTLLWGFKDDVVIRITRSNDQTLIDLHSVSRFGGSDLGANAKRIETFIEHFKQH